MRETLERGSATVGWLLVAVLFALAWIDWPMLLVSQRVWLGVVIGLLAIGTAVLQEMPPRSEQRNLRYEPEDKALVASVLQLVATTAWLYLRIEPAPYAVFIFALPLAAATLILHERVVVAETVCTLAALAFLKAAAPSLEPLWTRGFIVQMAIFGIFGYSMAFLARKLRLTLERSVSLTSELSKRLDQMQVVGVLVRQVEFFAQFDTLLERSAEIITNALNAERFGVLLLDPQDGALRLQAQTYGLSAHEQELLTIDSNLAPFRDVIVSKTTRRFTTEEIVSTHGGLTSQVRIMNLIITPLRARRGVIGAAFAANKRDGEFTDDETSYFEMLGGYVAALVESSELFRRVVTEQHTVERMARLMVGRELKMREMKEKLKNGETSV